MMKRYILILSGLFLLAFILRVMFLGKGAITFAYDQARDAFVVREMLAGDLKILGPPVSGIPGFYHGVLYYYLILPAYFFGKGSPVVVALWLSLLNSSAIFLICFFAYKLSRNMKASILSVLFFAVSFEATQYANWLSNPALGVLFVPLVYLGLYIWTDKKNGTVGAVLSGVGLGLSMQSNFSLLYHIFPATLWLYFKRKNIKWHELLYFTLSILISISTIIISQAKFGFPITQGVVHLFRGVSDFNLGGGTSFFLVKFFNDINHIYTNNLFPPNAFVGTILGWFFVVVGLDRALHAKNKDQYILLLLWIFSYLFVSPLGGYNRPHIGVGIGVGLLILAATLIIEGAKKKPQLWYSLIFVIIISNIYQIFSQNFKGQVIFAIQKDMILKNELSTIDYTYKKSHGNEFSINTLTSPLFINTTWSYLYDWYGNKTYGYLPGWRGRDQVGSLGNNVLNQSAKPKIHYLIIEDMTGIPEIYKNYILGDENSRSVLIDQQDFGKINVQERLINN